MVRLTYVQSSDDDDTDEWRSDRDAVTPPHRRPSRVTGVATLQPALRRRQRQRQAAMSPAVVRDGS